MDIFNEVVSRGVPYDNHYSDLYIPVTAETIELVSQCGDQASMFLSAIDGKMWYDIPLAYTPFWCGMDPPR